MHKNREEESIKQFDKWAADYDKGLWSFYFKAAYKEVLALSEKYISRRSRILDIGCGTGELAFLLSDKVENGEVVGLDIAAEMVEIAENKRLKKEINNIKFVSSSANSIPYDSGYFDVIFCLNSLHHLPDHGGFFKEVSRALKAGGKFILLDLVEGDIIRKMWVLISKVIFREKEVEFHSEGEISKLLADSGFKLETRKHFMFFTLISISTKL